MRARGRRDCSPIAVSRRPGMNARKMPLISAAIVPPLTAAQVDVMGVFRSTRLYLLPGATTTLALWLRRLASSCDVA